MTLLTAADNVGLFGDIMITLSKNEPQEHFLIERLPKEISRKRLFFPVLIMLFVTIGTATAPPLALDLRCLIVVLLGRTCSFLVHNSTHMNSLL